MRRRLHRRRDAGAGGDRPPGALRRRHGDQGEMEQRSAYRDDRLQDRHRRLRPRRHGLRRRHGESRLRRDGVRSLPPGRRRAQIRHPRFPPAQYGGRRGNRKSAQARRQVRMQHAGRPPVHHRTDARRTRLRRGLHRHRRRLPVDARHPRRFAQRRALRQRAAHPLQSDAGEGIPQFRHADPARQARRRHRRRQHRHGCPARQQASWAPRTCTASTAVRGRNARRAPRKCITPRKRASNFTG